MLGFRRRSGGPGWGELLESIGRSALDLFGAELAGARAELRELLLRALGAAVVALAAFAVAFWATGVAITAAIAGLAEWLPLWGAALVVFALLIAVAASLALVARARMRRLEGPGSILRRRMEDHLEFWRSEVLRVDDGGREALELEALADAGSPDETEGEAP